MSLKTELLRALDNEDEPLAKRLKIADNALNFSNLPLKHRETFLLKWMVNILRNDEDSLAFDKCIEWLKSNTFKELRQTDINAEEFTQCLNELIDVVSSSKNESSLQVLHALIENDFFQRYVKLDLTFYCKFLSKLICSLDNESAILNLLNNDKLFPKIVISDPRFAELFTSYCLENFCNLTTKFQSSEVLHQKVENIYKKCIFANKKSETHSFITAIVTRKVTNVTKIQYLFNIFETIYGLKDAQIHFKIIFKVFEQVFGANFEVIYQFIVITSTILGFKNKFPISKECKPIKSAEFCKSLAIFNNLIDVVKNKVDLSQTIDELPFDKYLKQHLDLVMNKFEKPNDDCFTFINLLIETAPILVDKNLDNILMYIMLPNNEMYAEGYENCLLNIFKLAVKLQRFEKFIAKLLELLWESYSDNNDRDLETRSERILPICVLKFYSHSLTELIIRINLNIYALLLQRIDLLLEHGVDKISAGTRMRTENHLHICHIMLYYFEKDWKTAELRDLNEVFSEGTISRSKVERWFKRFKTGDTNLADEEIRDFDYQAHLSQNDTKLTCYAEMVCMLLNEFLLSVRIVEYTVPKLHVKTFIGHLDHHKSCLKSFGEVLLSMEHNMNLMRSFLNACYVWGEMVILIRYYSVNVHYTPELTSDATMDTNLTYLHPYLTSKQWGLINERINNFGETPCKAIMQKMWYQKLRAILLVQTTVDSMANLAISSLDNYGLEMLNDRFCLQIVIPKLDVDALVTLSKFILKNINHIDDLSNLLEYRALCQIMFYSCCAKIDKAIKQDDASKKSLSSKLLSELTPDCFVNEQSEVVNKIIGILAENLLEKSKKLTIKEDKVLSYLNLIIKLPLVYFENYVREIAVIYLIALGKDVRSMDKIRCEIHRIIQGLMESKRINLLNHLDGNLLLTYIVNTFPNYTKLFTYVLELSQHNPTMFSKLKPCVDLIASNLHSDEKFAYCAIALWEHLEHTQHKNEELQRLSCEYKTQINDAVASNFDQITLHHLIGLVMCDVIKDDHSKNTANLHKYLDKHIFDVSVVFSDTKLISIFYAVFKHCDKFHYQHQFSEEFILKVWKFVISLSLEDNTDIYEKFMKVFVKMLKKCNQNQFDKLIDVLQDDMLNSIKVQNANINNKFRLCKMIMSDNFDELKMEKIASFLEIIFAKMFLWITSEARLDILDSFIQFQIEILKTKIVLSATVLDVILTTPSSLLNRTDDFLKVYPNAVAIVNILLQYRSKCLFNRIPSFLQSYKFLLKSLCKHCNEEKTTSENLFEFTNCAYSFSKLTQKLCNFDKHLASVISYVIADIVQQFEVYTFHPDVKLHLNNAVYSLLDLCNKHSIDALLRMMSPASTELFKFLHEHYRNNYKFKGKV